MPSSPKISEEDIQLLREVAAILRQGRVGDLVHYSWSQRLDRFADRLTIDILNHRGYR